MQKKALILLAEGFEEIETVTPADILRRGGVAVTLAGIDGLTVKGSRSIAICADALLCDCKTSDFDAVIVPGGGQGSKRLAASHDVTALLEKFSECGKIIAAICAAPAVVLAPRGILNGKKATCFPGCESDLRPSTTFLTDAVVCDGNIITSRAAGTSAAFSFAVLEALQGKEVADKVKTSMLF